jgi:hypothetical protein
MQIENIKSDTVLEIPKSESQIYVSTRVILDKYAVAGAFD